MATPDLDQATATLATNLLRHLEWQSSGFSLLFLFADIGPALRLANWLDERLGAQGKPLQRQNVDESFPDHPEAAVDTLIAQLARVSGQPGPLWLDLHHHPGDSRWNEARRKYLARLNERRFLLERDLARPLVLVLPSNFLPEVRAIAPDIWHVRSLSEQLLIPRVAGNDVRQKIGVESPTRKRSVDGELSAYREWQRMEANAAVERAFLPTAWRACEELLDAGRHIDAERVAASALALARQRVGHEQEASELRDLSITLGIAGRVENERGNWNQADQLFRESLNLARQVVDSTGRSAEALRYLSFSLNNIGHLAREHGNGIQADVLYQESLALHRELVHREGGSVKSLNDLSEALQNVGHVACERGNWTQADALYRESLDLDRQLVKRTGGSAESQRDLSVSLDNVGRVACERGDFDQADALYRESLELRRKLVERTNGSTQARRDLDVSLENISRLQHRRNFVPAAAPVSGTSVKPSAT